MSTVNLHDMVDTWNDPAVNFRAIRMNVTNTASGVGSLLMELLVGGSARLTLNASGTLFASNQMQASGFAISGGGGVNISGTGVGIASDQALRFSSTTGANGAADVVLRRDLAAGILAQRDGSNPQAFRVYNTYTNSSNYERGMVGWDANNFELGTDAAGTGVARDLRLRAGTVTATLSTNDEFIAGQFRSGNGAFVNHNSGTRILLANTDGVIALFNNAQNDFDRLQFGGTTAAFPSVKRVGSQLHIRLADDSAFAVVRASQFQITGDVNLSRDAPNVLALVRTSNPQSIRIYNTFTDSNNFERGMVGWESNQFRIGTENQGTGVARPISFYTNGLERLRIDGAGDLIYGKQSTNEPPFETCTLRVGGFGIDQGLFSIVCRDYTGEEFPNASLTLNPEEGALLQVGTGLLGVMDGVVSVQGMGFSTSEIIPNNASMTLGRVVLSTYLPIATAYINDLILHNTYTDGSNWERGFVRWDGNELRIGTEKLGTGIPRSVSLYTNGVDRLQISADGDFSLNGPSGIFSASVDEFFVNAPSGFEISTGDGTIGMNSDQLSVVGDTRIVGEVVVDGGPTNSLTISTNGSQVYPSGGTWSLGGEPFRFSTGYINNLFLYNSYTNASNWERGAVTWVSNVLEIYTQRNGTGSARPIIFRTNGGNRLQIGGAGTIIATLAANQNFIIAGLPTANPNVAGALWNDGGTVKVSAG